MIIRAVEGGQTDWCVSVVVVFFVSSRRRHTRSGGDWSSEVCSSDLCPDSCFDVMPDATFDANMEACCGCGVCEAVCPVENCITMVNEALFEDNASQWEMW